MIRIFKLFLLSFFIKIYSQTPALVVSVKDIQNEKLISNAKVCLEGVDIPAITAEYDKKKNIYFFNNIPAGYNTVMIYADQYNEKGYQNVKRLPAELSFSMKKEGFQLYSFSIEHFDTREYSDDSKQKYVNVKYPYYRFYIEDPYKIIITAEYKGYDNIRVMLPRFLNDRHLDLEMINPYWEFYKKINVPMSQNEAYPYLDYEEFPREFDKREFLDVVLPLRDGTSTIDNKLRSRNRAADKNDVVFILRKRDGSRFKRFNDPNIKQLREMFNVEMMIYEKGGYQPNYYDKNAKLFFTDPYESFEIIEKRVKAFNKEFKIDKSRDFFYNYELQNNQQKEIKIKDFGNEHTSKFSPVLFFGNIYLVINPMLDGQSLIEAPVSDYDNSSIGLGILDLFDEAYKNKIKK